MEREEPIATTELIDEIARYLAAIDAFRAAGCEPAWRREWARPAHVGGTTTPVTSPRIAH